jgi:hypothetical protein
MQRTESRENITFSSIRGFRWGPDKSVMMMKCGMKSIFEDVDDFPRDMFDSEAHVVTLKARHENLHILLSQLGQGNECRRLCSCSGRQPAHFITSNRSRTTTANTI